MRTLSLAAAITISLSSISTLAQEALIEFVDGEIASAENVNSNFQHLNTRLNAIEQFGGCSVTQDGSSVVITCADGSSGVFASAGAVVVLQPGIVGEVPDVTQLVTGPWYVLDASDTVLGVYVTSWTGSTQIGPDEIIRLAIDDIIMSIRPDPDAQSVKVSAQSNSSEIMYFAESDCLGTPYLANRARLNHMYEVRENEYAVATEINTITFESRSRRASGKFDGTATSPSYFPPTPCENFVGVVSGSPMRSYTPPEKLQNASLPLRIATEF